MSYFILFFCVYEIIVLSAMLVLGIIFEYPDGKSLKNMLLDEFRDDDDDYGNRPNNDGPRLVPSHTNDPEEVLILNRN